MNLWNCRLLHRVVKIMVGFWVIGRVGVSLVFSRFVGLCKKISASKGFFFITHSQLYCQQIWQFEIMPVQTQLFAIVVPILSVCVNILK